MSDASSLSAASSKSRKRPRSSISSVDEENMEKKQEERKRAKTQKKKIEILTDEGPKKKKKNKKKTTIDDGGNHDDLYAFLEAFEHLQDTSSSMNNTILRIPIEKRKAIMRPLRINLKQLAVHCYDAVRKETPPTETTDTSSIRIRLCTERTHLLAACCWSSCTGSMGLGCGCPLLLLDEGSAGDGTTPPRWTDATGWGTLQLARYLHNHLAIQGGLLACQCHSTHLQDHNHGNSAPWPQNSQSDLLWLLSTWRERILARLAPGSYRPPSNTDREAARILEDSLLLWQPPHWIGIASENTRFHLQRGEHIAAYPPQTLELIGDHAMRWHIDTHIPHADASEEDQEEGDGEEGEEGNHRYRQKGEKIRQTKELRWGWEYLGDKYMDINGVGQWWFTLDPHLGATLEPIKGHQGGRVAPSSTKTVVIHDVPPLEILFADALHVPHTHLLVILQHLCTLVAYGLSPQDFSEQLSDIVLEEQEADPEMRHLHMPLVHGPLLDYADILVEQTTLPPTAWTSSVLFGASGEGGGKRGERREALEEEEGDSSDEWKEPVTAASTIRRLLACYGTGRGGPMGETTWSLSNWRLYCKRERMLDPQFMDAHGVRPKVVEWYCYDGCGRHAVPYTSDHLHAPKIGGVGTIQRGTAGRMRRRKPETTWVDQKTFATLLVAPHFMVASFSHANTRRACRRASHGLMRALVGLAPFRQDVDGNTMLATAFERALQVFEPGPVTRRAILDGTLEALPAPFLALWLHIYVHVFCSDAAVPQITSGSDNNNITGEQEQGWEKTYDTTSDMEDRDKRTAVWQTPYVPASSDILDVVEWLQKRVHYRRERQRTADVRTANTRMRYLLLKPYHSQQHGYSVVEVVRSSLYEPTARAYTHFGQTFRVLPIYPPPPSSSSSSLVSLPSAQPDAVEPLSIVAWNHHLAETLFLLRYQHI